MKPEFVGAMRRATELVRAGNPAAATEMIQSSLGGEGPIKPDALPRMPKPSLKSPFANQSPTGRSLRETLAKLAAAKPVPGMTAMTKSEPTVPEGARFDHATFTCVAGSRDYRVYVPNLKHGRPNGLIMMLHGCTQSPVDFANGTDMNRHAEEHRLIVVYPAQSRGANMQSCWNWFASSDQHRAAGEPAILAGLAMQLQRDHDIPKGKVFVAGLSAGAAMAVILGRTYPEVFAGVGAHSGLPYKSASDMPSAFAAMGGTVRGTSSHAHRPIPTIVFHGTADQTVNANNGQRIFDDASPTGPQVLDDGTENGRRYTRATVACGAAHTEHWRIDGLCHAWSGGQPAGSYTDPAGPDASAEMIRFFLDISTKG